MIKILFITLGHLSGGEFTIAFEFSRRLSPEKYEVCFLTSQKGEQYLVQNDMRYITLKQTESALISKDKKRNKEVAEAAIEEFKPDYFIISDVYTMWYAYTWAGIDLEFLRNFNIPIGSIDSYEFGSTDYVQDYYGGYKAKLPDFIDQCDFVVRYCPINKIGEPTDKIKYTYLFDEIRELDDIRKKEMKRKYGIRENDKVVFMTNSNWESLNVNRLPALSNLIMWIPNILMKYIYELEDVTNETITIVHVGPNRWDLENNCSEIIQYKYFEFLRPNEFDQLLSASDLFLTTNIISSSLIKAVYASIPSMVFQNDRLVNFENMSNGLRKMPEWYQNMAQNVKIAFPFRLFPFGWHKFLSTVLRDNEYLGTFEQVNLFQRNKVNKTLALYLNDQQLREKLKSKQKAYIKKILDLPSPDNVMESLRKMEQDYE